jgi:putative FmdB family regulatory protein
MPVYRFHCFECGESFDQRLAITELGKKQVLCPHGHKNVQRVFSAPTIIYKGSGWYITDHAKSTK